MTKETTMPVKKKKSQSRKAALKILKESGFKPKFHPLKRSPRHTGFKEPVFKTGPLLGDDDTEES